MASINTLIKPTHECNLRCNYCFHEKYGYDSKILDINMLKKYIKLLSEKYSFINLVWHGGEPLMIPLSYYEEIYNYCEKLNSKIIFSIQTNGTLLDQQKINFFKHSNTSIGLSFDGLTNELTRSHTQKVIENIKLLHDNDIFPGAIMVINQLNVNDLINNYNYFKSLDLSMKINPMFNDGAAKNNSILNLNPDDYIKNFIAFFKYWANDKNCNINVSTCEEITNLVINEQSNVCTYNSCLGKWLCFDSNGYIYPCDRLCNENYNLGNINYINYIDEVFQNYNFLSLLKNSVERRKECINKCEYFKNCYSGCNANALLNNTNISCYIHKNILNEIKKYILEFKNNLENMNSNYTKILYKKKVI